MDVKTEKIKSIKSTTFKNAWYDIKMLEGDVYEPNFLIDDCVVHNSGGIEEYIESRNNIKSAKERIDNIHKSLWEILGPTYSVPIFQEQIMKILQIIGGFTLAEADNGRKILKLLHKANQEKNKDFTNMLNTFKNNAKQNGMSEENIIWLLNKLGEYSSYSFCKSHSFSYALNAYISMWLKIHYPLEYYSSLLNYTEINKINWHIKQIKKSNIQFNKFELGKVKENFKVDYNNNTISLGLSYVKGLNKKDCKILIDKYKEINNIHDLLNFIKNNKISKRTYTPLCKLNFFKHIYSNSAKLLYILTNIKWKKNDIINMDELIQTHIEEYTSNDIFKNQKELFGFYISKHPFDKYEIMLNKKLDDDLKSVIFFPKSLNNIQLDNKYFICGIVSDIIMKKTKKDKEYWKIILEDNEKQIYITIWDIQSIKNLKKNDFILLQAVYSKFGFTKERTCDITKYTI